MGTGKLPNEQLAKILEEHPPIQRDEVLEGARIGFDTAQIQFGNDVCVLSTDPITGAVDSIGTIGITIAVNDIATSGAEPIALLLTILMPVGSSVNDVERIQREATQTANALGVQIVGGHTEITSAVNQCVLSVAVIGKMALEDRMDSARVQVGDLIAVTKTVGREGTAILAADRAERLSGVLTETEWEEAKGYLDSLSVLPEGRLGAKLGVQFMHDITEGGLLGAVYESAQAVGKGIRIRKESVPVTAVTKRVAAAFGIDPLRLIGSGSLLIVLPKEVEKRAHALFASAGVALSVIGEVCEEGVWLETDEGILPIEPPRGDDLYKALAQPVPTLVLATDNRDKVSELRQMLEGTPFVVQSKEEAGVGDLEVEETGTTLAENALIKARAVAEETEGVYVLSDDTGLFVQALDGEPGVYAARYAGEGCTYADNRMKLLETMKEQSDRSAYFETVAALIGPDGQEHLFAGRVEGAITDAEIGEKGFGYDAVFLPENHTRTFGEMTDQEKNAISHRRRALEKVIEFLQETQGGKYGAETANHRS